jgi:hypothetical protein
VEASAEDILPLGAHLVTPRLGYAHHGIYAGGNRVIHYAGFKRLFRRGPVEEISLDEFRRGWPLEVKPRVAPRFSGADVVARARSRLGESSYRPFTNNCEHFSEWCITGTSRSPQVEALATRVLRALGLGFLRPRRAATQPEALRVA